MDSISEHVTRTHMGHVPQTDFSASSGKLLTAEEALTSSYLSLIKKGGGGWGINKE